MTDDPEAPPSDAALLTDLYEITMAASYFAEGMFAPATFSFFVRSYPPGRGYFVAAGLDDVLRYLESLRFSPAGVDYLASTGAYSREFLSYLSRLRFTGDVDAMPEGTLCFAGEPILEVTAPIIEAQLVETFVINQLHLQTLLASKAARCVSAARGRQVVDFSLRRAHGTDAGMKIARCCHLVGAAGTSNVRAGFRWGISTYGTMAHSYVQSFAGERQAFRAFARCFPGSSTFLVDTYDTIAGVRAAIDVAREMESAGNPLRAIRLDSGDLDSLSRQARALLDAAGLPHVRIFASGGLNEYAVDNLVEAGAPIDAFGIGTEMGVSADAPWLDCAYKLVEFQGRARLKLSPGKATLAGRKQVWRSVSGDGRFRGDCLSLHDEPAAAVARDLGADPRSLRPILQPVMRAGHPVASIPTLEESRAHFGEEFAALDPSYKDLREPARYPVAVSSGLRSLQRRIEDEVKASLA